ncbi:carcinoembryonic antigen-related cell adhesion molecule 5-like [Acanthopagrus latus]|uniref:carcinoembryonic antigen-related cell adhesion molecule 5-like n=1 Tax=Acanthopagrus latus TaxID=8177 RepID=UPI00187C047D|nr:carcinoembryonic antigen-related cell adhesion molecule 5-like [Acanthopagrus latus]
MEKKRVGTSVIVLLALIQGVLTSIAVEVKPSVNPATAGDTVTLSLSPSTAIKSGSWAVGESVILTWIGEQQAVFPSHAGRASVNILTGALTLSSVSVVDSGVYVVQGSDPQLQANASITVVETISNVTLSVNETNLMEFNGSAVVKCSVSSGSSLSFLWMNGSSEVTASDRVQLTVGNSTLTIVNVTRYDRGPFMCRVLNPVSNGTSDALNFTISYGPDTMALTVNGNNSTSFSVGSNLTMLCSAQSNPPALLQWAVRGELVNTTGPLLQLFSVSEDQSGPYSCLAFNNHTNMNSTITTNIVISKSGSEQQAVSVWLLPLLLLFGPFFSPAHSQSIHASENPIQVGSNVTLSSQTEVTTGIWLSADMGIIVFIASGNAMIDMDWKDRVTFDSTTSSLTIKSLEVGDSGVYILEAFNSFRANLTLSVQVPISNVTLKASETNLVEFNDTAVLMCSVSKGTSLSYVWMNGSSVVTAGGGVQFSNGGANLTIAMVTRYDKGPFTCNVSNGISHEISAPVQLNISYGPSNVTMTVMPMRHIHRTGSNITLMCSAESKPQETIQWMVDGMYLNQSGPQLNLESVAESNSGNYKCLLHNTVTSRFASASAMIMVLDPLASVVVNQTGGPAILHKSFTMCCEVVGSVDRIQWWKNGNLIYADNTTDFSMGNKTLTLNPVQQSDNGHYACQAFNYVSNMTSSPFMVEVSYGPYMPTIMGPNAAKTGDNVTLSCHASSHPPSTYKWFFNGSNVANMSKYYTPPLTKDMSGKYICEAYNNVTDKNSTAYTMLTVIDPITDVQIEASMNLAIEGHYYNLTCNVTGPADHVYWMKNDEPLHEDNSTVISKDNMTVSFNPLAYNDTGDYKCMAINAVENMTSLPYMLLVNFGPKKPIIQGPAYAETGRTVDFECSAKSMPPSNFTWWFNGSEVANTSMLTTGPLSLTMSGEYTCVAYNAVTGKNSSNSKMLKVVEAITSVMVQNTTIPINNENFTLTCVVTGPYDKIHWMKDNMYLNMNSSMEAANMSYHIQNNMLHFTPVTLHSDGMYQCVAANEAAHHNSSSYMLLVNYGPLSVKILTQDAIVFGIPVSLKCYADSRPECDFYWFVNNHSLSEITGSEITFTPLKDSNWSYTCKAMNPVTNITMYKTKTFTIGHASTLIPSQGSLMLMGLFALSATVLFD